MERVFIIAPTTDADVDVLEHGLNIASALGMTAEVFDCLHPTLNDPERHNPRLAGVAKHQHMAEAKARHTQALVALNAPNTPLTIEWGEHFAERAIAKANPTDFQLMIKAVHPVNHYMPTDWHLIRNIRIPLLLMTEKPFTKNDVTLVALNLNNEADDDANHRLVAQGRKLAEASNTQLHLVYIHKSSTVLRELDLTSHQDELNAAHAKYHARLLEFTVPEQAVHLMVGDPKLCLVDLSCKLKAAYLVVGTAQRKGLMGLVIGNTAEAILEHIHSNVLVVPSKGEPLPV